MDLFAEDQVDLTKFELSERQVIALMNGDESILKLLQQHPAKPRKPKKRKWTLRDALREYEEDTGFRKP